jgi:hypothetical protein
MPLSVSCDKCGCHSCPSGFNRCRASECRKIVCGTCASSAGVAAGLERSKGFWDAVFKTAGGAVQGACPLCGGTDLKELVLD